MAESQVFNTEMSEQEVIRLAVDSQKFWQFEVIIFVRLLVLCLILVAKL